MTAQITYAGSLDMQVCVPEDWSDKQAKEFADRENECGTENGWVIRKQGDPDLNRADERVRCASRPGHIHIMLDA